MCDMSVSNFCSYDCISVTFFFSFFPQLQKTRRAAVPCPGLIRTPACSLWTRKLWSTTLPQMQGKQIAVSLYPPFNNPKFSLTCTAQFVSPVSAECKSVLVWWGFRSPSVLSLQCSDRTHKSSDLPGGRWRGRRDGRPAVHPQDKAQGGRLPSPGHPDLADGASANHEGWVQGQPLLCSHHLHKWLQDISLVPYLVILSLPHHYYVSSNRRLAEQAFNTQASGFLVIIQVVMAPAGSVAPPGKQLSITWDPRLHPLTFSLSAWVDTHHQILSTSLDCEAFICCYF